MTGFFRSSFGRLVVGSLIAVAKYRLTGSNFSGKSTGTATAPNTNKQSISELTLNDRHRDGGCGSSTAVTTTGA
jgi:hypothetical protein